MFSFEFNEEKSQSNLEKHGIDFIQAQKLWNDPCFVEIPAKTVDEPRFMVIGRIAEKIGQRQSRIETGRSRLFPFAVHALKRS